MSQGTFRTTRTTFSHCPFLYARVHRKHSSSDSMSIAEQEPTIGGHRPTRPSRHSIRIQRSSRPYSKGMKVNPSSLPHSRTTEGAEDTLRRGEHGGRLLVHAVGTVVQRGAQRLTERRHMSGPYSETRIGAVIWAGGSRRVLPAGGRVPCLESQRERARRLLNT